MVQIVHGPVAAGPDAAAPVDPLPPTNEVHLQFRSDGYIYTVHANGTVLKKEPSDFAR